MGATMRVFVCSNVMRERFSKAMSAMYQAEVPQYETLLKLVAHVNEVTLKNQPELARTLTDKGELDRINVERHGAIRVGTAQEMHTLRRLFAVFGMYPVGYYDLSVAGVPVHSTAFRPVDREALAYNPFRIFTSLLRLELIENVSLREQAARILAARQIFSPTLLDLLAEYEAVGGFDEHQANLFISEAINVFRWHQEATVDHATYQQLLAEHRLIADVVCFKGPHINHLTPRTLDIDMAQRLMPKWGLQPKDVIEGPPQRQQPILLRQTSFKALQEAITFADSKDGSHLARFGEIEQRGVALTPAGRQLYDRLLANARAHADTRHNDAYQATLSAEFEVFPDDIPTLYHHKLAYFEYHLTDRAAPKAGVTYSDVDVLLDKGWLSIHPQTYEDFLPVSAAGIFQSNLGGEHHDAYQANANQNLLESALGVPVIDEMTLYAQRESDSLHSVLESLHRVEPLTSVT